MSTSGTNSRARLGLHHVTVVPSNYDGGDADDDREPGETGR
ncbi:MAG: hypothetical protein ABEH58_03330 [Haloplanus sp.]